MGAGATLWLPWSVRSPAFLWLRAQLPISGLSSGAVGQLPVPRFMLRSEGFFEDGVENRGQQVGWWSSCWRLSWLKALPAPCTLALSEETFCWVCPCWDAMPYCVISGRFVLRKEICFSTRW